MQDALRVAHFDLKTKCPAELTPREELRIRETVAAVPPSWRRVIDVGCGDGRLSKALVERGCQVLGVDWSANSVAHFPGPSRVCDIRAPLQFEEPFDGAVCCEVLEHLSPEEAALVIANLKSSSRHGFLISVPAREAFASNTVRCQQCLKRYHIWGHIQQFWSFSDVDAMVGQTASARKLISAGTVRASPRLADWQRRLGFSPWAATYLCPHCGEKLREPSLPPLPNRFLNKGLAALQRLGSPLRRPRGWFVCVYDR